MQNVGQTIFKIFLELRSEIRVKMSQKQDVTLSDPTIYPHTKYGNPTSNITGDMLWTH